MRRLLPLLLLLCSCRTPVAVTQRTDSVHWERDSATVEVALLRQEAERLRRGLKVYTVVTERMDSTGVVRERITEQRTEYGEESATSRVELRDSIASDAREVADSSFTVVQEAPPAQVKKVVPAWCWYLLAFNVLLLLIIIRFR